MSTAELDIRIRSGDVPNATRELQRLERQGRSTEQSVGSLTDTAGQAAGTIKRLTGVVAGLSAAMAASEVIKYADAWTTVSNKLVNSVKDHETLAQVQDRVFAIAQESRSSLEATATLYGRLSAATGDYIKNGETVGGMVQTIAKAMAVSGATTSEAEGAIVQLSQAFGAGALRGEEFNSVNEAAPRLMQALADSLGVARGQLKSMAAEGELTTEVLYNAWNGQSKAAAQIQSEFERMSVTAGAKIAQAQNNLTKWIGENKAAVAVTEAYGDAAVGLSNNLDTLADAGTALAAVMGARLAGGLAQAATAKVSAAAASRALAVAELNGAKAATTAASAEVALLQAQVANWTQRIKGAATENQASRFRERLASDTALLTGAENSLTAATSRLSAAQAGAAVTGKAMSGAMALLGGPVGVAVLAASAIFAFSSRANEAADPTATLTDRVRQLTSSMKELSVAEVDKTIGDIERQMVSLNTRMNLAESMDDELGIKEETKGKIQAELDSMTAMYRKMMEQRKKILSGADLGKPEDVKFTPLANDDDDKKAKKAADAAKRAYDAKIAALAKEQQAEADDYQKRLAAAGEFNARMEALNASELDKARNERGQRMIENQAAYNNNLISEEQYQLNLSAIKQRYEADRTAIQKQELDKQRQLASDSASILIQQTQFMTGTVTDMLRDSGKENSGLMQGMLAAQKALAIPSIIVSTEQAAAAAMAHESLLGGLLSGTMAANLIRAQGAISTGIVAGQAIGGFAGMFDNGGNIGSGQWGIVGENGPEIVSGPANVTSRKKTAAMAASAIGGDSGGMVVNVYQTITGNGDAVLAELVDRATRNALNETQADFAKNGRLRKTLGV